MSDARRPWELLYDGVAIGMRTYTTTALRVETLGVHGRRLRPGQLIVATHRAESDVPVICGTVFFELALWRRRDARLWFAARDDLFEPGFFAGFPAGLPGWARRLLWRVNAASGLPRVRVLPISGLGTMTLAQALRSLEPDAPLDDLLPPEDAAALAARAAALGRPAPRTVREALTGAYADILWRPKTAETLDHPAFAAAWRRRAGQATHDLRAIVGLVASRRVLLLFPEGRPSPDGGVGPLRRGLGAVVRHGRPEVLVPVGLAYDPLVRGRPRVALGLDPPVPPPSGDVEAAALELMRHAIPLTAGQLAATWVREAALAGRAAVLPSELAGNVADAVKRARAADRHLETALGAAASRPGRLDETLSALVARGVLRRGRGELGLDPDAALADPVVDRLAREDRHARAIED